MKTQNQVLTSVLNKNGLDLSWSDRNVLIKRSEHRKSPVTLSTKMIDGPSNLINARHTKNEF